MNEYPHGHGFNKERERAFAEHPLRLMLRNAPKGSSEEKTILSLIEQASNKAEKDYLDKKPHISPYDTEGHKDILPSIINRIAAVIYNNEARSILKLDIQKTDANEVAEIVKIAYQLLGAKEPDRSPRNLQSKAPITITNRFMLEETRKQYDKFQDFELSLVLPDQQA